MSGHDTPRGTARERILDATLLLIAAEGIDAVTHRAVATRAGVSPGSTTHHFATRDDLVREAFRFYLHAADQVLHELDNIVVDRAQTPLERVRRVLSELVEREFAVAALVRAEYELLLFAASDPVLAADVRVWEARVVSGLAAMLEAAGTTRPVDAARTLVNLVRGYELERLLNPQLDLDDFQRRLGPVLDGLCPQPA